MFLNDLREAISNVASPLNASPAVPDQARRVNFWSVIWMAALFLAPLILGMIGAATPAKLLFPLAALALAVWLARVSPPRYLVLLLLTLMLSSGIRHFIDWRSAYSTDNPITLTPILVAIASAPGFALYLLNRRRHSLTFAVMLGCILYGMAVPLMHNYPRLAFLGLVDWLAPILVGVYVIAHAGQHVAMRGAVTRCLVIALPLMATYGLWQFVAITPWDAYYMKSAAINSIGFPLPFQVRVFGTMNHAGILATMLATGILLIMPVMRGINWLGLLLAVLCMLVTTQRSVMIGLVVGIAVLAVIGHGGRMRATIFRAAIVLGFGIALALTLPGVAEKALGSLNSFSNLNSDGSAQSRIQQYYDFPARLAEAPLGLGLNWTTDPGNIRVGDSDCGCYVLIDSGLINGMITFGLPVGILFFGALALLMVSGARIALRARDPAAQAEFAAVMLGIVGLPFGSQELGATGIFLYMALGLLLARGVAR